MKRLLTGLLKSLITTVIVFGAAEAVLRGAYAVRNAMVRLVPLPYALGDEYGPIPPWLDRLMILVPDNTLIWRSLPNVHRTYVDIFSPVRRAEDRIALLRRFVPTLPAEFRSNPTWTIDLNSQGYRSMEVPASKSSSVLRVACVGDSWTFGMNVNQDRTYPSRLAEYLQTTHPDTPVEVLNFGVLGYSSFQGLQLTKLRVLAAHPDVVAIGFGMNDSGVAGYRDKDMITTARPAVAARVTGAARELELYKLLHYLVLLAKFRPQPVSAYLSQEASKKETGPVDYASFEEWTRVSPVDYEQNVRDMINLATGTGAKVVLLDNELWDESPYRPILQRLSADTHAPLVDSLAIIAEARRQTERDLEARLNLAETAGPNGAAVSDGSQTTVIFRVFRGAFPVPGAMAIAGNGEQLGAFQPNTVLMRDDGMEGDQRAGDGVWSYRTSFNPGTRLFYVYTNSGSRGQWEGLDIPHIRTLVVPSSQDGRPVYLPIETFGRVYMQADDWHTDATGYDLIARAVAKAISSTDR